MYIGNWLKSYVSVTQSRFLESLRFLLISPEVMNDFKYRLSEDKSAGLEELAK